MTNREVMQQALKCIERLNLRGWILADFEDEVYAAITALKAALEQPVQEPVAVAYLCENGVGHRYFRWKKPSDIYKPIALYTTPPAAQPEQQVKTPTDELYEGFAATDVKSIPANRIARGEPVAWIREGTAGLYVSYDWDLEYTLPLFAHPPRPWVGLTEFQFAEIYNKWNDTNGSTPWGLNQALEVKLRKLNT
jgi:hypothetical protein